MSPTAELDPPEDDAVFEILPDGSVQEVDPRAVAEAIAAGEIVPYAPEEDYDEGSPPREDDTGEEPTEVDIEESFDNSPDDDVPLTPSN